MIDRSFIKLMKLSFILAFYFVSQFLRKMKDTEFPLQVSFHIDNIQVMVFFPKERTFSFKYNYFGMVLWITWILIVAPQKGACLENPMDRRSPADYSLSSVQLLSRLFAAPWTAACQACLSITNSWSSLKLMSIESVMPSKHLILCRSLLLLPLIFPSIRVFSNESVLCIRWPKVLEFQLQHQSFQWTPRTDLL